jgi:hypothetical protein
LFRRVVSSEDRAVMFLTLPVGFWVPFFVDTKMEQRLLLRKKTISLEKNTKIKPHTVLKKISKLSASVLINNIV